MSDNNHSRDQARAQLESVRAMLAAAELDWDRLAELRDDLQELLDLRKEDLRLRQLCVQEGASKSAHDALAAFEVENGDRLRELEDLHGDEVAELAELEAIAGDCKDQDDAQQRIYDDPLSVEVRDGWRAVGSPSEPPAEFQILLCTGGPAVRIMGDLDEHGQPTRAYLQHQDWGTPWADYIPDGEANDVLCRYASFHLGY